MPKPKKNALETLAAWLAARAYTKCELRRKIYQKETFPPAEIEHAVAELERLGFLSDRRYTEDAVRILKGRGFGVNRIRSKLLLKGIGRDLLDEIIREDNAQDDTDPLSGALDQLRRRERSFRSVDDPRKKKMKALRLLAGRGFPADIVYRAVNLWLKGEVPDDDLP